MSPGARTVYEGFGRRFLAGATDVIVLLLLVATVTLVGVVAGAGVPEAPLAHDFAAALVAGGPWWLAGAAAALVLFWAFMGATPGMLLVGSRVVDARSARRLSLARSAVRVVALALGLAALGIGILWSLRDARHQGLHDKLAGSVVVREDESLMTLEELLEGVE